ncbi:MAG: hypothetical protein U0228_08930 [Myxococcaceae bacterium]
MTDFVALISKDAFEKLAGKDPKPATWLKLDRYDSKHAALEGLATKGNRLFLLTVRGDAPWLVKVLMLCKRDPQGWKGMGLGVTLDLSPVRHLLELTRDAPKGKLAMSLQTPRALSEHDSMLLMHLHNESDGKYTRGNKPYVAALPKWLLADAANAGAPEKAEKAKKPAKKSPAKPAKAAPMPVALVDAALALIEENSISAEDADGWLDEPKRQYGLRGEFTESVQSVIDGVLGGVERKELLRMLGAELAPFVDGPSLSRVLAHEKEGGLEAIADQFALRAVDDLCRALLALAVDQPERVPATCAGFVDGLGKFVPKAKQLLG